MKWIKNNWDNALLYLGIILLLLSPFYKGINFLINLMSFNVSDVNVLYISIFVDALVVLNVLKIKG